MTASLCYRGGAACLLREGGLVRQESRPRPSLRLRVPFGACDSVHVAPCCLVFRACLRWAGQAVSVFVSCCGSVGIGKPPKAQEGVDFRSGPGSESSLSDGMWSQHGGVFLSENSLARGADPRFATRQADWVSGPGGHSRCMALFVSDAQLWSLAAVGGITIDFSWERGLMTDGEGPRTLVAEESQSWSCLKGKIPCGT